MQPKTFFEHDVHELIQKRRSPRAFSTQQITANDLRSLFEAARWAASCFNAQPWRWLVARKEDAEFQKMLDCLAASNQLWAQHASVLLLSVTQKEFAHNGKPNRHAQHDLGLAMGQLTAQATHLGIIMHQMAGFDVDKTRETYNIPENYDLMTITALGYPGDPETLPAPLKQKEQAPRVRAPQQSLFFSGRWEQPLVTEDKNDFEEVLDFWFGKLDKDGKASPEKTKRWWKKDESFDQELRDRFGALRQAVLEGKKHSWLETPRGRIASIIVLDQFSRNMFRGTAGMYEADELALKWVNEGLALGMDKVLATDERVFFYMSLMHSEALEDQERCIELFKALNEEGAVGVAGNVDYAIKHRDIVAQWGRFPHRNELLNRPSTPEEIEFLKTPGSSF